MKNTKGQEKLPLIITLIKSINAYVESKLSTDPGFEVSGKKKKKQPEAFFHELQQLRNFLKPNNDAESQIATIQAHINAPDISNTSLRTDVQTYLAAALSGYINSVPNDKQGTELPIFFRQCRQNNIDLSNLDEITKKLLAKYDFSSRDGSNDVSPLPLMQKKLEDILKKNNEDNFQKLD